MVNGSASSPAHPSSSRRSRSRAAQRRRSPGSTGLFGERRGRQTTRSSSRPTEYDTGLQRVSAAGGSIDVLTRPDREHGEADHLWPEILPGGHAVLFTITSQTGGLDAAQVAVRDLRTGTQKILVRGGSDAHYVTSGHLVYIAAGALRAIPFDVDRLETHGTAVSMLPLLSTTAVGAANLAVANDGTLVYVDPGRVRRTHARSCGSTERAKRKPSRRRRAPTCSPASRPTESASRSGATIRRTTFRSGTWKKRRSRP